MQGIAALAPQAAPPQGNPFSEQDAAVIGKGMNGAVNGMNPEYRAQLKEIADQLTTMSPEELTEILKVISILERNPENYAQNLQIAAQETGIDPEDLPQEYNAVFFGMLKSMVQQAMSVVQSQPAQGGMPPEMMDAAPQGLPPEMMAPQGFAKGGIVSLPEMARQVASAGRYGDTMLAHVRPDEVAALRRMGGSGTINPNTGLREYGFWKSARNFFKQAAPVIGTVALGIVSGGLGLGLSPAVIGAVGSGVGSLIAGAKPADALKSALIGGIGAGVASGIGSYMGGGSFTDGFSSAFPSWMGGSSGAPGSYDLMGNLQQKLLGEGASQAGMAGGVPGAPGLPTSNIPMPPSAPIGTDWSSVATDTTFAEVPGRIINAPTGLGTTTVEAGKAAASGSGGGLGGLFDSKWKTAALLGGGAALLSGMGASDRPGTPPSPSFSGPSGTDLLRQNPGTYGFDVNNFRPASAQGSAQAPVYIVSAPQRQIPQGVPYNFRDVRYPVLAHSGGHIKGEGTGTSDSIPARLSDGEFVLTAEAVRGAGGGDRMKGAKKMYSLMNQFERMA